MRPGYKLVAAAAGLCLGLYLINKEPLEEWTSQTICADPAYTMERLNSLEQKSGLAIVVDRGDDAIPELWRAPPARGSAESISQDNLCRIIPVLKKELEKYPHTLLQDNLDGFYLLDSLTFYGVAYGGTSLGGWVFLTSGNSSEGYTEDYLKRLIHHEISSIFFRNHTFPSETWSSINPEDFSYAASAGEVLKSVEYGERESSATLYKQGFLSDYGTSTLENDFNLYAETLFADPGDLEALALRYPRVRQKSDLLKSFYKQLSGEFAIPDSCN